MVDLTIGDKAPAFTLPADGGETLSLADLRGKYVVLYFYPKDNTPGCTRQACDLRDSMDEIRHKNAVVVGISKDNVASHDKFKAGQGLNFTLASDADSDVCERYGVWVEKNMYGRKYMGIARTSFLIDPDGNIIAVWRKVKAANHRDDVLEALEKHSAAATPKAAEIKA